MKIPTDKLEELRDFGKVFVPCSNHNMKIIRLEFHEPMFGLRELEFVFMLSRSPMILSLLQKKRRERFFIDKSRVRVSQMIEESLFLSDEKLSEKIIKRVEAQLKKHNHQMMAHQLFFHVHQLNRHLVGKPEIVKWPVRSHNIRVLVYRGADIKPVNVPIKVFSSLDVIKEPLPPIPSVRISADAIQSKIASAKDLLIEYANHNNATHI